MADGHRLALIALCCNLLLGIAVFIANGRRPTSRSFLLLTIFIGGWLVSLNMAFIADTASAAALGIRLCSFFGYLIMPLFAQLRTSIVYYDEGWERHLWRNRWWFASGILVGVLSFTPFFLKEVRMPAIRVVNGVEMVPEPIYGWADSICLGYLLISAALIAFLLTFDQLRARQIPNILRVELQFVIMACLVAISSIFLTSFLQRVTGNAQPVRYAPLRVVAFDLIIAYGITSRGILHVRTIFRLAISYALLAIYAMGIFTVAWFFFSRGFRYFGEDSAFAPAMSVAVVTALLFNATGTPVRRLTKRILPPEIDFERIVNDVSHMVQSVTTLEALFDRSCRLLSRSIGSPSVRVMLFENGRFRDQARPFGDPEDPSRFLASDSSLVAALRAGATDIALEDLQRRAPSPQRNALLAEMDQIGADLLVPIRFHEKLSAVMTVAPRPSGHVYGIGGRSTLALIARQLGVAIANSRLYTEARQSQAYNQFLVEHLPCGVIATDPAGGLTVVNPEARRLLGLDELAPPPDLDLPPEIARLIPATLDGDFVGRDEEIILRAGARDEVNLRVSCLPFASEISRLLGAVLVLNDYSAIERLQRQIRQADRLASIGTLASGMAHEIKNPLTALKTFTQLLPKRYGDPEFRSDFALLGGNEILRIERIVNDLLAFARPAPLVIEQVNVHDVIATAVRLVTPQAAKLNIEVRTSLCARPGFVAADRDRLQQVLLNLILNALQASEAGGWVELLTESEEGSPSREPSIRLDVRDGGRGISREMLPHIFDPFFTTKSEGTGLGLSVSYNIIAEHKGRLEVASESGEGTCFSIYLPVA